MTASSTCSGTVDNFWSRDDIRVHTFGGSPKAVEVLAEGSVRGQADPHRRREASRSGSGAAARLCGRVHRRQTALAARRHGADQDAKTRMTVERHIRMVADAVMCKLRVRQHAATGRRDPRQFNSFTLRIGVGPTVSSAGSPASPAGQSLPGTDKSVSWCVWRHLLRCICQVNRFSGSETGVSGRRRRRPGCSWGCARGPTPCTRSAGPSPGPPGPDPAPTPAACTTRRDRRVFCGVTRVPWSTYFASFSRSRAAFAALRSISKFVPSRLIRTFSTSSVEPSRSSTRNVLVTVAMSIKVPEWRSPACGHDRVSGRFFQQVQLRLGADESARCSASSRDLGADPHCVPEPCAAGVSPRSSRRHSTAPVRLTRRGRHGPPGLYH